MKYFNIIIVISCLFILGCNDNKCNKSEFEKALCEIQNSMTNTDIEKFKSMAEDSAIKITYLTYGRQYRDSTLGTKKGYKINSFFNKKGIYNWDQMSVILFRSLHRKLNGKHVDLNQQVDAYTDYWKKIDDCEKRKANTDSKLRSMIRVGDTINFAIYVDIKSGFRNGTYLICPKYFEEFDKSKDLLIKGIVVSFKSNPDIGNSKFKICNMNRYDTPILDKKMSNGDTLHFPISEILIID